VGREASIHPGDLAVATLPVGLPDEQFAPLPAAADPDRAWIEEGLRRALALATIGELSALMALLVIESDSQDSLAGWLRTLVADEMDHRRDQPRPAPSRLV
jgi:hypothetical protein